METMKTFILANIIWFIAIPVLILAFAAAKHFWPSLPDDSPVEEAIEQVIQDKTGVDVDLTPGSPDVKTNVPSPVSQETLAK